jgi:hypothetical protein
MSQARLRAVSTVVEAGLHGGEAAASGVPAVVRD